MFAFLHPGGAAGNSPEEKGSAPRWGGTLKYLLGRSPTRPRPGSRVGDRGPRGQPQGRGRRRPQGHASPARPAPPSGARGNLPQVAGPRNGTWPDPSPERPRPGAEPRSGFRRAHGPAHRPALACLLLSPGLRWVHSLGLDSDAISLFLNQWPHPRLKFPDQRLFLFPPNPHPTPTPAFPSFLGISVWGGGLWSVFQTTIITSPDPLRVPHLPQVPRPASNSVFFKADRGLIWGEKEWRKVANVSSLPKPPAPTRPSAGEDNIVKREEAEESDGTDAEGAQQALRLRRGASRVGRRGAREGRRRDNFRFPPRPRGSREVCGPESKWARTAGRVRRGAGLPAAPAAWTPVPASTPAALRAAGPGRGRGGGDPARPPRASAWEAEARGVCVGGGAGPAAGVGAAAAGARAPGRAGRAAGCRRQEPPPDAVPSRAKLLLQARLLHNSPARGAPAWLSPLSPARLPCERGPPEWWPGCAFQPRSLFLGDPPLPRGRVLGDPVRRDFFFIYTNRKTWERKEAREMSEGLCISCAVSWNEETQGGKYLCKTEVFRCSYVYFLEITTATTRLLCFSLEKTTNRYVNEWILQNLKCIQTSTSNRS